jgi:hypothetical protein
MKEPTAGDPSLLVINPRDDFTNLFERSYQRHAVASRQVPCHDAACGKSAETEASKYFLGRSDAKRDERRLLLFCLEHAQEARMNEREASVLLDARRVALQDDTYPGPRTSAGFQGTFHAGLCRWGEDVIQWERCQSALTPYVEWLDEPCFEKGCDEAALVRGLQLSISWEYSLEGSLRLDRWYCSIHAEVNAERVTEAEAALAYLGDVDDADDSEWDLLNRECIAVLERCRCLFEDL